MSYFKKDWTEIEYKQTINGKDYFVEIYPIDIENNDEICIRVYEDEEHLEEFGNGIWLDSDFGSVTGNDELDLDEDVEDIILTKAQEELKKEGII